MLVRTVLMTAALAALIGAAFPQEAVVERVLRESTVLEPGVRRERLVVAADGIVIDGKGAVLDGGATKGEPGTYRETGIVMRGRKGVVLRNLRIRGFRRAAWLESTSGVLIEACDFSDNHDDPAFGWGDGERTGGLFLDDCRDIVVRESRFAGNWNGIALLRSDHNVFEKNVASHCSNVCLKLETSSNNVFRENDLSYGLRISPGEVHARDSTGVLIESGSDHNVFTKNDVTHGGDGIFIRVLNGWCSRFNVFVENDCSYANNNGFEAWSPDNVYIRNRANHCSYGFWLGGSDRTTLIGNEAGFNGRPDGFHNAPESDFRHGGIVIVHGTGTHTLIEGNWCHDNAGAGIVVRGDLGSRGKNWPFHHLIVQKNRLERNRWGFFARFADWVDVGGNRFEGNETDVFTEEVSRLTSRDIPYEGDVGFEVAIDGPEIVRSGTKSAYALRFERGRPDRATVLWDAVGDDWSTGRRISTGETFEVTFERPGFVRVGATVAAPKGARLAWKNVYVLGPESKDDDRLFTVASPLGVPAPTAIEADEKIFLVGRNSQRLAVASNHGGTISMETSLGSPGLDLGARRRLSFWMRSRNENIYGFDGPGPVIRFSVGERTISYVPVRGAAPVNLLNQAPYPEAREGWQRVVVDLDGRGAFRRFELEGGAIPPHVDGDLEFLTVRTNVETQQSSALAALDGRLWLMRSEGEGGARLSSSADGAIWSDAPAPSTAAGTVGASRWWNGLLATAPGIGPRGTLFFKATVADASGRPDRLLAFDVEKGVWSAQPVRVSMTHGATFADGALFGLAHARMGNFGGPLERVVFSDAVPKVERTVPGGVKGANPEWWSRAAQLAQLGGTIYAIKNDWKTDGAADPGERGDRLMAIDPRAFVASTLAEGRDLDDATAWQAAATPVLDLGALPFEVGHGAALIALPPRWSSFIGAAGGLFIVAGQSPSNHEGEGTPSARYALFDIAGGRFLEGKLPGETGMATSATFHQGKVFVKRGGLNFPTTNAELWVIAPLDPKVAGARRAQALESQKTPQFATKLGLDFDSNGHRPYTIWIDGLAFE